MQILITRINRGEIRAEKKVIASTGKGLAVFVGIESSDNETNLVTAAKKIVNIRIFKDSSGKLSKSVKEENYGILCIPNFTLCASTEKGRRPSFEKAMKPAAAKKMFAKFILLLQNDVRNVEAGMFGTDMDTKLELDGPVNITLKT